MAFYPYRPAEDPGGAVGQALARGLGRITDQLLTKQADEEQYQRIKAHREEDRAIRAAERAEEQAWREEMQRQTNLRLDVAEDIAAAERREQKAERFVGATPAGSIPSDIYEDILRGTAQEGLIVGGERERLPSTWLPGALQDIEGAIVQDAQPIPETAMSHYLLGPDVAERREDRAILADELDRQWRQDQADEGTRRWNITQGQAETLAEQSRASAEANALRDAIAIYSIFYKEPPQKSEYQVETKTGLDAIAAPGLSSVPRTTSWAWKDAIDPTTGQVVVGGGEAEFDAAYAAWREGFAQTHPQYRDHPLLNPIGETSSIAETPRVEGYGNIPLSQLYVPPLVSPYRPGFEPTDPTEAATTDFLSGTLPPPSEVTPLLPEESLSSLEREAQIRARTAEDYDQGLGDFSRRAQERKIQRYKDYLQSQQEKNIPTSPSAAAALLPAATAPSDPGGAIPALHNSVSELAGHELRVLHDALAGGAMVGREFSPAVEPSLLGGPDAAFRAARPEQTILDYLRGLVPDIRINQQLQPDVSNWPGGAPPVPLGEELWNQPRPDVTVETMFPGEALPAHWEQDRVGLPLTTPLAEAVSPELAAALGYTRPADLPSDVPVSRLTNTATPELDEILRQLIAEDAGLTSSATMDIRDYLSTLGVEQQLRPYNANRGVPVEALQAPGLWDLIQRLGIDQPNRPLISNTGIAPSIR